MTVAVQALPITYNGNGTAAPLAVPFRFLAANHLVVTRVAADGARTVLVRGTHYSVSGGGEAPSGTVTPLAPIAVGDKWEIDRVTPREQPTAYPVGDDFPAKTHELALDRQMLVAQEQDRRALEIANRAPLALPGQVAPAFDVSGLVDGDLLVFLNGRLCKYDTSAFAGKFLAGAAGNGRFVPSAGLGGGDLALRTDLASKAAGSKIVAFAQDDDEADERDIEAKLRETALSVVDYGAIGDGITDNTAAIIKADQIAASQGKEVYVPAGSYVTDLVELTAPVWRGEGPQKSRFLYKGAVTSAAFYPMFVWDGVDGVLCDGIGFDGNCSADPTTWTSLNYNSFTGCGGPQVRNGKNARITNCIAENVVWSGFNFYRVQGGLIDSCHTYRARGIFGDGVLVLSSTDVIVSNCNPEDYTRIGICADRIGLDGEPLCQRITIRDCKPQNGHDGSILYGGTEYSCGVWAENTIDVCITGVQTSDNVHRGIVAATGPDDEGLGVSRGSIKITESTARNSGEAGVLVESLGVPIDAVITGVSVYGARFAFVGNLNSGQDKVFHSYCHAEYDASTNNGRGFAPQVAGDLTGVPEYTVGEGCTVHRTAENPTFLNAVNPDVAITADVGTANNASSALALTVTKLRKIGGGTIYMRWYSLAPHQIRVSETDLTVAFGQQLGGQVDLFNNTSRVLNIGTANTINLVGGRNLGGPSDVRLNALNINYDCNSSHLGSSKVVFIPTGTANYPSVTIGGHFHEKDIAANGELFEIQDAAGQMTNYENFRWFNLGAATSTKSWATYASGGGNFVCNNVSADNSVASIFDIAGGSGGATSYAGVTKRAMR